MAYLEGDAQNNVIEKLFSDTFPSVNSDKELQNLREQFSTYDPGYICQGSITLRAETRLWMEKLWREYKPFADKHFLKEFKHNFTQRSWELYLGITLLNRGFKLGPHRDEGPDFEILDKENSRKAWLEAIAVKKGTGADRVPELIYGIVVDIPTDQIVLRIAAGLKEKHSKYVRDLEKGLLNEADPYIIALDRSELDHPDVLVPNVLKALFAVGDLALRVRVGGKPVKNPKSYWTHQFEIKKSNERTVPTLFFGNNDHKGVSAVIYSMDHVINSPRRPSQMGENFVIVHNPFARNPLPSGFFSFGDEYRVVEGFLKKTRKRKKFIKPSLF